MMLSLGDCVDVLSLLPPACVDACVTDPPYGQSFMGKDWDSSVPGSHVWEQVYRVLKPGGHVIAFGGTRTYHHLAMGIEEAGFEIRDMLEWVYANGFPKSLDVSKALDRMAGADREKCQPRNSPTYQRSIGNSRPWMTEPGHQIDGPVPVTPDAQRWQGWGSALKPSHEPMCLARKPLIGSIASNVLEHGTGAINVDGCRVGTSRPASCADPKKFTAWKQQDQCVRTDSNHADSRTDLGRWPANLCHDGSPEVLALFPQDSGDDSIARIFFCPKPDSRERNAGIHTAPRRKVYNGQSAESAGMTEGSVEEKFTTRPQRNYHPSVKPIDLMRWLCRLVTPPGGVVLDPYMGSGTTGCAAVLEGFRFWGIDQNPAYLALARERILHWGAQRRLNLQDNAAEDAPRPSTRQLGLEWD